MANPRAVCGNLLANRWKSAAHDACFVGKT
jgi:hypothetical protein